MVDNAIVVVENIIRFKKEGYTISEAAAKGTSEVGYAIISSTITTVLAFAPLALLESGPGAFLRSLPIGNLASVRGLKRKMKNLLFSSLTYTSCI